MAQLIYRSPFASVRDCVKASWDGSASACLGAAIDYFTNDTIETWRRLTSGEIADVPEIIVQNAQAAIDRHARGEWSLKYVVVVNANGSYSIWISDGPDRYDLID